MEGVVAVLGDPERAVGGRGDAVGHARDRDRLDDRAGGRERDDLLGRVLGDPEVAVGAGGGRGRLSEAGSSRGIR